jgi:hypothetical protein
MDNRVANGRGGPITTFYRLVEREIFVGEDEREV